MDADGDLWGNSHEEIEIALFGRAYSLCIIERENPQRLILIDNRDTDK